MCECEDERGRVQRERDPSSSCSRCPFGSFERSRWHENWGRKCRTRFKHRKNVFLSPFKIAKANWETKGRTQTEGGSFVRSFARSLARSGDTHATTTTTTTTGVCDILKSFWTADWPQKCTDFGVLFLSKLRQARWCDLSAKTRRKQSFKTWSTK